MPKKIDPADKEGAAVNLVLEQQAEYCIAALTRCSRWPSSSG